MFEIVDFVQKSTTFVLIMKTFESFIEINDNRYISTIKKDFKINIKLNSNNYQN